eukprot:jgi/Phyca11/534939/estExt2_fgenesh1_pg.C_PHYCAscaffold_300014
MTMRSDATKLKLLLLSDLEGQTPLVNQLCEELVSSEDSDVDAVLVTGGFVAKRGPHDYEALEAVAAAEGDMMALISRLEMIICRVLYIPDDNDPPTTRSIVVSAPSLTQYSSNVYYREEQLINGVTVMGEARYFKLVNDGKDPMQDRDMVLVLRDSAVKSPLPVVESSFFAGLLPMLQTSKPEEEPRAIEIIGGSDQHPHAQLPLIYPGSLRLGQYTILQLEKDPLDDKCRRHKQRTISIPASAPAASTSIYMMQRKPERVREKRRFSVSPASEEDTPSKRRKDQDSFVVDMTEEKEEEDAEKDTTPNTQQDTEMQDVAMVMEPPVGHARAQQLLLETVEDRVAARQVLRNPEWVNGVWASLEVPAELELAMQLNLTVDSLATWVKDLEASNAQEIQTRVAALIVEVAQKLPPVSSGAEDAVACVPNDEGLSKIDEEVAAIAEAEDESAEMKAFDRAKVAKRSIECLSSACKAYMDRLSWFAQSFDTKTKEKVEVEESIKTLGQKLDDLVATCTEDVNEAQRSLADAKQIQETRTLQIVQLVDIREKELLGAGETQASARLMSVVDVWSKDDVEAKALWKSRSDSEDRAKRSTLSVKVAEHALAFHKNLCILFRKVRERREASLTSFSSGLKEAQTTSINRATVALEKSIPMLKHALHQYYTFYSVQQLKAKEEQQELEKALEAHIEYFGDSAPIKKGDIERRIREFIGVTQSSMQVIMEIAEGQQHLWELKQSILPMSDVMKKFVSTIEEASGGVVVMPDQQAIQPQPEEAVTVLVTGNTLDEQVIPTYKFVRGEVLSRVDDDKYMVQYDNGDKFSVPGRFLFTKEMYQKAGGADKDMEMEDAEDKGSQGSCAIMYNTKPKCGDSAMTSRFSEESAMGDAWQEKMEQLQNELALAHPDHTGNLLSPTLSSFDFDDDSSEEDSDDSEDQAPGTPAELVDATRHESEILTEKLRRPMRTNDGHEPFNPSLALELRDRQSIMHHLNTTTGIPGRMSRSSTTGSALEAFGGSSKRIIDGKNGADSELSQQQHLMYRIMHAKPSSRDLWYARAHPNKLQNVARSIMFSMHLKKEHIFERFFVTGMSLSEKDRQQQPSGLAGFWKPKLLYDYPNLLRMIIENEMEQHRLLSTTSVDEPGNEVKEDEQFEVILRPLLDLAVEFTIYHEENPRMRDQTAAFDEQNKMASIATKLDISAVNRRVVLSEDASPKEYERVKVGDILEAVDSIATGNRPMRLRFRRPTSQSSPTATKRSKYRRYYTEHGESRLTTQGIGLPLDSRRSTSATSSRNDTPIDDKVVEIMAYLLLEKQVVIMSDSPAKISAPWYELSEEQDTIITLTMQEAEIFLRDLGFDISSQDLAASISGGQSFYDRLQEEVAKEVRNSMYEDYLDEFTQTQLFCQYYESLLQPEAQKAQR